MENNNESKKHWFSIRKFNPGPSTPVPGPRSSHPSMSRIQIQQPASTKARSFWDRVRNRFRPPSPAPSAAPVPSATATPTPSTADPGPSSGSNISPAITPNLSLVTAPNITPVVNLPSGPSPGCQSSAAENLTLWQEALAKIPEEDKVGVDPDTGSLLHNLINATQKKKEEIEAKRWVYKNEHGETVAYADRFLTLLNKYTSIVDIAIQHDPHVVVLAWAGFRFLLQVATADMENVNTIFGSLEGLVRILFRCDIYEKLYGTRNLRATAHLNTSIVKLYVAILKYLCAARRELRRPTGARMLRSIFSDSGELFKDIQSCEKEMQTDADMAEKEVQEERTHDLKTILAGILEPIQNLVNTIAKIDKYVDRFKRHKILDWISDIPVEDHHTFSRGRRHGDTGRWLLQHSKFREWRNSNDSSMLWLRGAAGAGKTILASKVIDVFRSERDTKQHALAFFYCNYRDAARRDPATALRALVKQLSLHSPIERLPKPVLSIYEARENSGHLSGALRSNESRDLIVQLSTGFEQTNIVIDAVDECDRDKRRDLFEILQHIVASTTNVRILLTGRSDGDIQRMLCGIPSHYIETRDNQSDIETYIHSEIERCCREGLLGHREIDEELKSEIITTLIEKADGMFMWVHLQFGAICRGRTPAGIRRALQTLPKGLEETYLLILNRIVDTETAETVRIVNLVLKWILCVQSRCTEELLSAVLMVGVNPSDKYRWNRHEILDICQNLVVYDRQLRTFRFAHFSVHEFLVGHPEFDEEETHADIAEICLTVLTSQSHATETVLVHYSTLFWAAHVRFSGEANPEVLRLSRGLLQPSLAYRTWYLRVVAEPGHRELQRWNKIASPLWAAYFFQLYSIFELILDNGSDGNDPNDKGESPILHAIAVGDHDFVERMIKSQKIDLGYQTDEGWTALSVAAMNGREEVVRMLLEEGRVDPDSKDRDGRTPLSLAARSGHQAVVLILLEKDGVGPDSKDKDGRSSLSFAASFGHEAIVKILVEKDAVDPDSKDSFGRTPLSMAAEKGHEGVVQILLDKDGVDPNVKDKGGQTPLSWAAKGGHGAVVQMLLAKDGVDPDSADIGGRTPLSWAASCGDNAAVHILLQQDGVDMDSKDDGGQTPLSWAAKGGHGGVVWMLLKKNGVNPDSKDQGGRTPLSMAAEKGHIVVVEMLLENQVDPDSKDDYGQTPLSWAADNGREAVVRILLGKERVNPDSKDNYGQTPLSFAAGWGHEGVVKSLLNVGVDPDSKNEDGRTPLYWAAQEYHPEVMKILEHASRTRASTQRQTW